jgi:hypothetical protein
LNRLLVESEYGKPRPARALKIGRVARQTSNDNECSIVHARIFASPDTPPSILAAV